MYIDQPNGTTYVYDRIREYDYKTQSYKDAGKHLKGHIPVGGSRKDEPIPNRPKKKPGQVSPNNQDVHIEGNDTAMLDIINHLVESSGVGNEIKTVLEDDEGLRQKVLTLIMYNFSSDGETWPGIEPWSKQHFGFLPYRAGILTSDIYDEVFKYLGDHPDIKNKVFLLRASELEDDEIIALDSSTYVVVTDTGELRFVKKAPHKDKTIKPVYKIIFFMAIRKKRMIAYTLANGNTPDSKTIQNALTELAFLKLRANELIVDGGYVNDPNLGLMLFKEQKFVAHISESTRWVQTQIEKNRSTLEYGGQIMELDSKFCGVTVRIKRTFKFQEEDETGGLGSVQEITAYVYLHILFSTFNKAKEESLLRENYLVYKGYLLDGVALGEDKKSVEDFAKKYMIIEKDKDGNIKSINRNEDAWRKAEKTFGYLTLVASDDSDINSAFEKYRSRERIEEGIKNHKYHSGGRKTRKHHEDTLDGQLFVQFEGMSLRDSFELKVRQIIHSLAVPNGEYPHDLSTNLKLERTLRRWCVKTSLTNILKNFDAIRKTKKTNDTDVYIFAANCTQRDRLFLIYMGIISGGTAEPTEDEKESASKD